VSDLRLGTRGSALALWQATAVSEEIARRTGRTCTLVVIRTSGDRRSEGPLSEAGGKRLFVKEIEDALLAGSIDLAVHSAKDVPAELPDGLTIGAVPAREDPRDAIVVRGRRGETVDLAAIVPRLGPNPRIATSSVRRLAQLARLFPGAAFEPIRGNIDTRLRKLDEGRHDAVVLAVAGMRRLGFGDRISAALPIAACVPAPGQGSLAVEIRSDDRAVADAVAAIDNAVVAAAYRAERRLVSALGGGCEIPLGAIALPEDHELAMEAIVISRDGGRIVRATGRGPIHDPEGLGARLGAELVDRGAGAILDEVRSGNVG
jgi:hydroxymethylbilane synthase